MPGVASALAERLEGGRYINVEINREKAARYGMTVADVQLFVTSAVGGAMVGETVEGIARYPINLRYPQSWRDSPQALRQLPILTPMKQQITLADVADIMRFRSHIKPQRVRKLLSHYMIMRQRHASTFSNRFCPTCG